MARLPGGEISVRPLHFIWLCDCSGSMSVDGKIQALNFAIRETLPEMIKVAEQNLNAEILLRCLCFSHGAQWKIERPTSLDTFRWTDLEADALQQSQVNTDIVFLVDTSGSMSDEIEGVKASCLDFAQTVQRAGSHVRLGLVGFDIGGHRGSTLGKPYTVHNLSKYTIGVWPLTTPEMFSHHVQSLTLSLFGGGGCYSKGQQDFSSLLEIVADTIAKEVSKKMANGQTSAGTDMGAALQMLAETMKIPPMPKRALSPVLVLISDGQPTVDFQKGLKQLMAQPWGKKAVSIAISIGADADQRVLQEFIGHSELKPLHATNPQQLLHYIRWASTEVLRMVSTPPSQDKETKDKAAEETGFYLVPPKEIPDSERSTISW